MVDTRHRSGITVDGVPYEFTPEALGFTLLPTALTRVIKRTLGPRNPVVPS